RASTSGVAAEASVNAHLRGPPRLPGQQDLSHLLHPHAGVHDVGVSPLPVRKRFLVVRRPMPLPGQTASALRGHDAAQRSLEVRLVLEVERMQLFGRFHAAHLVRDRVELLLAGRQSIHGLVDIDVPASQRVRELPQLAEGRVDLARVAGQHRAVLQELSGLARERATLSTEHRSQAPFRRRISSVSLGTIANRSPTTNRSANSPMGASGSLLMATTFSAVCIPTRCWMAPEIPAARYRAGFTTLPVWPICS